MFAFLRQCFFTYNYHFANYHFANATFKKKLFMKDDEAALNVRSWWECSGDELCVMNLRWSNFVIQGDECHHCGGNQAYKKDPQFGI